MLTRARRRIHFGPWVLASGLLLFFAGISGAYVLGTHSPQLPAAHASQSVGLLGSSSIRLGAPMPALPVRSPDTDVRVDKAMKSLQISLDSLARELGTLRAKAVRLDAFGERLVRLAGLNPEEFSFEELPAIGGPDPVRDDVFSLPEFVSALNALSISLDDRQPKFDALESIFLQRDVDWRVHPSGAPTTDGWLSSKFGPRVDPVTGRRAFHGGVDYAGAAGGEIFAVAAGVVTRSEKQPGYGNLVEISHGQGLHTRYAHNQENLVNVGDVVTKGQSVALIGQTGRSTGPHVHFEVLRDGKAVDPLPYIKGER